LSVVEETSVAETVRATTEAYYDSVEADSFYAAIWGGEDIHIGIYEDPKECVAVASTRTVDTMASRLDFLSPDHRVLDIGAGYGGAGRSLARRYGCQVDCLNLSDVQNARNRELTKAAGLDESVHIVHASFEAIPGPDSVYRAVWSQDAILHSGDREKVLAEVARVLEPGGDFLFTDPMQSDGCPPDVLQPVLDRIHLDSLASPGFYRMALSSLGFEEVVFTDLTHQLRNHYDHVRRDLEERRSEMVARCGEDYVARMLEGLGHWVSGADRGHLVWGIFHFRKQG
jgi:cyclopropane fatty-acyl-phospholipid synthase-like methyltransferase